MKTFPMFLRMNDRRVVIVGGGEQAAQKTRLIMKSEAEIHVMAPEIDDELSALAAENKIHWNTDRVTGEAFKDTALVFIGSGCPGADAAIHAVAVDAGALVNVVDQPHLCDALTPSIVDRDPVVVAIGTEGTAPVLARQIKTRMETMLEPRLGDLAATVGRLRDAAAARLGPRQRRDLYRWVFGDAPRRAFARGAEREGIEMIKTAIQTGEFTITQTAQVAVVGAADGTRDLMTLRGVQRLQEADVIYYDTSLDRDVLELARRDAERVPFTPAMTDDILTSSDRVVVLAAGDPAAHAITAALTKAGAEFEIVAGV